MCGGGPWEPARRGEETGAGATRGAPEGDVRGDGRRPVGRPEDPGRLCNLSPPPRVSGGTPTAPTHSSRRQTTHRRRKPQTQGEKSARAVGNSRGASAAPAPFKDCLVGVACGSRPRPTPPRPADSWTRSAGLGASSVGAARGLASGWRPGDKGQNPASSCCFPPAWHLPTSLDPPAGPIPSASPRDRAVSRSD